MSEQEKQIEEINELTDLLSDIGSDWDNYIDECEENEEEPCFSYEDFHAHSIIEAGYRKERQGEWIKVYDENNIFNMYRCSCCDYRITKNEFGNRYCPNCGAKMKGAE